MQDGQLLPFAGWGLAGLPVVGTFLQAAFALAGVEARTLPVVGGVVDAFISLQVFKQAAIQFKASTAVVLVLFVLIAAAWVGQGFTMELLRNRDATFACAGLVSVLFLVLFFGVYSSLFGSGIGVAQLALFFAVPFVASAGALGGAWLRDWEVDLDAVHCEVGLWHGESDANVPIESVRRLAERLPAAELHVLEDADHLATLRRSIPEVLASDG